MNTPLIENIFSSMTSSQIDTYSDYWNSIKPETDEDMDIEKTTDKSRNSL
jgi:hypothetical protein